MKTIQDKSFGIVPVFKKDNDFLFCVVKHGRGEHWGFPKGHAEPGETSEEAAIRELMEETSIKNIQVVPNVSFVQKYEFENEGIIYDKTVKYFLGQVSEMVTEVPQDFKEEILEIKWLTYKEVRDLITFENAKVILDQVHEFLVKNYS